MIKDIELEIEKIYNKLLPSINNIINNYSYLNISKDKFEKIIKEIIADISNKKEEGTIKKEIYIKKIKLYLESYVKITLNESNNSNIIINNYINKNLSLKNNIIANQKELKKISNFFEKHQYIPSPDLYIELINNNETLSSIIKQIISEKVELIEKKGLEIITDNEIILTILEVYCTIKNITFTKEEIDELNNIEIEESNYQMLDSVKTYLLEIQKPLLSFEEEQRLFKRKVEGDKQARQILIEHNLKLVVSIAKKYNGRGLDILELIQEGNIGLITAIDKFDYTKGCRISTYATWWIKQSIQRALEMKTRTIRLPSHLVQGINKCFKEEIYLEKELGRKPTAEEIAKKLNIHPDKLNEIYYYAQNTVSLNLQIDDEETELGNLIPSNQSTPDEEFDQTIITKEIQKILKMCINDERQLDIILLRYGFIDGKKHTLEEIGQKYNLTRERIRQIEAKVIQKLRKPKYKKLLSVFYLNNQSHNISYTHQLNKPIKEEEKTKKEEQKAVKKDNIIIDKEVKSILETFLKEGYTKEEIISIKAYLGQEDREILLLTNGNDLDNPKISEKIKIQNIKDYNRITIPRIRIMLKTLYGIKEPSQLTIESITENSPNLEIEKQKNNNTNIVNIKKEEKKMKKNKMTIFENLGRYGYTKEEILHIIENLKEIDKELIKLINGSDLENPTKKEQATSKDITKYYTNLIPKILRKLKKEYGIRETEYTKEKDKNSKEEKTNLNETKTLESLEEATTNVVEKEVIADIVEPKEILHEEIEISKSNNITKEEYIKILELIKTKTFNELMSNLNPKDAIIIALRLGYVDNKYFSSESIATFLGIEEQEVIEATKEILNLYKEQINKFIDTAISYKEEVTKKRTLK